MQTHVLHGTQYVAKGLLCCVHTVLTSWPPVELRWDDKSLPHRKNTRSSRVSDERQCGHWGAARSARKKHERHPIYGETSGTAHLGAVGADVRLDGHVEADDAVEDALHARETV